MSTDLIERYLHEVGRRLPKKTRADVQAELRTLLADMLEERASAAGRAADEELVVEMLREFGEPEQMAARYQPEPSYLIGPRMFPAFLVTTKIVLAVLAALVLFGAGVSAVASPTRLPEFLHWRGLWGLFEQYTKLAFYNLALLVLVFAVNERVTARKPAAEEKKAWDPRELPAIEDRDRISAGELVFKTYAVVILFLWLNFFPEWFGILFFTREGAQSIPFYELGLRIPVLLLNLWWAGALLLNVTLLRQQRWTRETRWAELGLGAFAAVILYLILAGSELTGVDAAWVAERGLAAPLELMELARAGLPKLGRLLHAALTAALYITIAVTLVRLYRALTRYPLWS